RAADKDLLFLTCRGAAWVRLNKDGHHTDGIGQEFNKLQELIGIKKPRRGIYAFRHTFETEGGDTTDQVAVNAIMGHKDRSMAANYRERIKDYRLLAVSNLVREYYFPQNC